MELDWVELVNWKNYIQSGSLIDFDTLKYVRICVVVRAK